MALTLFASTSLQAQERDSSGAQQNTPGDTVILSKSGNGVPVTGVITDAATGRPVPAISVTVPAFSAALTDDNGNFTIKVPDYRATLLIAGEGFQSKEIALKGRRNVSASLYEETFTSVYDQVNLPLGSIPLNRAVNAVGSVNVGGAWTRPVETPDNYLQGKVAGLQPI
ncbi:MAG TPA: carboxypeptidase-like regulatory domain-containing protein, partial [Flavisolibacter sp.]|nr:carboxypeptidase-like regulatory domain-containing protein [Flavisolibacter sp.]